MTNYLIPRVLSPLYYIYILRHILTKNLYKARGKVLEKSRTLSFEKIQK